ncbi:hypothetical protein [Marimonas arenosa]|uniref:Uncharacterized protein n=1 Tax=Marimonas arenosa TaxID=1795305 RepID=A0AAE3W9Y2_9RHOB|nr:hypothetical protein [Marimonas arenosa]MDQ2088799.1 hypothetical protein [Marimonas arenosa]
MPGQQYRHLVDNSDRRAFFDALVEFLEHSSVAIYTKTKLFRARDCHMNEAFRRGLLGASDELGYMPIFSIFSSEEMLLPPPNATLSGGRFRIDENRPN